MFIIIIAVMVFSMMLTLSSYGENNEAALVYSKAENWVETDTEGTKPVDVSFIYPTVAMETANEDGYASIDEMADTVIPIWLFQTAASEESCNVYMPYYRQASMTLADTTHKDNATYLDLLYNGKAYTDVAAALDYYFENYNNGKPFILAAHSQGSALEINVLIHYMQEHKDYLPRMVAAYAIGFAPSEDIFNEETGLKFAEGEDDYNVVVSFTTEGPTAEGKTVLLPEKPMVINPLNWKTDDTYANVSVNKGTNVVKPDMTSELAVPGADNTRDILDARRIEDGAASADLAVDHLVAAGYFKDAAAEKCERAVQIGIVVLDECQRVGAEL